MSGSEKLRTWIGEFRKSKNINSWWDLIGRTSKTQKEISKDEERENMERGVM